jgi:hypothetical protein
MPARIPGTPPHGGIFDGRAFTSGTNSIHKGLFENLYKTFFLEVQRFSGELFRTDMSFVH